MSLQPRIVVALCIGVVTALSATPAVAAPATLDATFGGDGRVMTNFNDGLDGAAAVAVQADGKIVAVGSTGGSGGRFALARYHANGTLDGSFSADGIVRTDFASNRSDVALGVAIQTDGKIVAVGETKRSGSNGIIGRFAVARYESNGHLDPTFGGDGKVTTDFSVGWDGARGVVIQTDGKIVVAGAADIACSCSKFALVRYDADGSPDGTFGGDGKVTTFFGAGGEANAVAIQANGAIVAVGGHPPEAGRFEVARYDTDGTLDSAFGGDGKVTTNMGQGEEAATGLAIQANGKIVVAGYTDVPHEFGDTFGPGKFALARYRVDGTLDAAFGGDGRVVTGLTHSAMVAEDVAIQADDKIVAAGHAGGSGGRFALVRYGPGGGLDTTFGGDGRVTTDFTPGEDLALSVAIQIDGRIVAAGRAGGGGGRFALARYAGGG